MVGSAPVPVTGLSRETLTGPVRRALGRPEATVLDWAARLIAYRHVNPITAGLYRVSGIAGDSGKPVPWSLVLKILQPVQKADVDAIAVLFSLAPAEIAAVLDAFRWDREARAYRSGLLDTLAVGLRAPRCYGVDDYPGPVAWLWLEDVATDLAPWSVARYGSAARHLGAWNGGFLGGRSLPEAPWLSSNWLHTWATCMFVRPAVQAIGQTERWNHPVIRRAFPVPVLDRLLALWRDRPALLAALDRLPRTLSHLDAFRSNLLSAPGPDGGVETVALDWSFLGRGALGEEIGQLVSASLLHAGADASRASELGETVLEGYLTGLRETGWRGDGKVVRLGYAATAALRWGLQAPKLDLEPPATFELAPTGEEDITTVVERRAAITYYLLDLADEARKLVAAL